MRQRVNAQESTKKRLGGDKKKSIEKVEAVTTEGKQTTEEGRIEAETVKSEMPDNAMLGSVVGLNDLVMGKSKTSALDAQKMYNNGQPLLFKDTKGKFYVVYNTDGSFAGKKLSIYAGKNFGIVGRVKSINGVRVLIAERFIKG